MTNRNDRPGHIHGFKRSDAKVLVRWSVEKTLASVQQSHFHVISREKVCEDIVGGEKIRMLNAIHSDELGP